MQDDDFRRLERAHEAEREHWAALTPEQQEKLRREREAERASRLQKMTERRRRAYQQRREP